MLPCGSVWLWVLVVGKSAWILDFALHTLPGAPRPNVHLKFHFSSCCAARQSNPLAFIARKQWNLSEAEEYNETSRADGRGGHHSFRRPGCAVTVGHKRL